MALKQRGSKRGRGGPLGASPGHTLGQACLAGSGYQNRGQGRQEGREREHSGRGRRELGSHGLRWEAEGEGLVGQHRAYSHAHAAGDGG